MVIKEDVENAIKNKDVPVKTVDEKPNAITMVKAKLSNVFKKKKEPIPVPTDPTIKEK